MTNPAMIGYLTIVRKETIRIFRIWTQSILPSAVTQGLYFIIFGSFIGAQIGQVSGMSYIEFLVPGLIMMSVITNAFSNTAFAIFLAKFQRNIEEILVSPMKPWAILSGFVTGGIIRGLVVGFVVFLVSALFTSIHVSHLFALLFFFFITCVIFSLLGFFNGLLAKQFDDIGLVPTFILTPLTYLGGVFYSLDHLPPFWRSVSYANPIVYMIDGFRYGFSGVAATPVLMSAAILSVVACALYFCALYLLKKGVGLKS